MFAAQLTRTLQDELAAAVTAAAAARPEATLLRVALPVDLRDPLGWLQHQRARYKLFWAARDSQFMVAGIGAADALTGHDATPAAEMFATLQARLPADMPALRYYGGLRFDATRPADPGWRPFGRFLFILPQFELVRHGDSCLLAANFRPRAAAAVAAAAAALSLDDSAPTAPLPSIIDRHDYPDRAGWAANIDAALATFASGSAEKIVLARQTVLTFDETLDPIALVSRLHAATPSSFRFCFQIDDDSAFIGASPERLYWRHGRMLRSEALAGTRRRGQDFMEDRKLRKQLLYDKKERHEHMLVQESILRALRPLCSSVSASPHVTVKVLERVQHRYNQIQGTLAARTGDADLLAGLHPTPAVGGLPRDVAIRAIAQLEPFDRGWYAAPVGWVGKDSAEFAVAIRSGLVHGNHLALYAGAGIVPGSVPENEWQEIENKLGNFRNILS